MVFLQACFANQSKENETGWGKGKKWQTKSEREDNRLSVNKSNTQPCINDLNYADSIRALTFKKTQKS